VTAPVPGGFDAVVYDFGGVFTASPFAAVADVGRAAGLTADEAVALMLGPYDIDTDHPWHRAERGEVDLVACREEILTLSGARGARLDLWDLFALMAKRVTGVRHDVVEHTRKVRSLGLRTALLTNNVAEARPFWEPLLPLGELFDEVVDSSAVGMRKPDPRIYAFTLERLGVAEPGRAVFLDDWPGNVAAARGVGMAGIVVGDDPSGALRQLGDALGLGSG